MPPKAVSDFLPGEGGKDSTKTFGHVPSDHSFVSSISSFPIKVWVPVYIYNSEYATHIASSIDLV